jgi:glycosyltransferase involved in cell wall biosynthesis
VGRELIDGVDYWWLETPSYSGNGVRRAINILCFVIQLFRFARELTRAVNPDVVIASSTYPIDIFPAAWIAARCKARLIFELHDLWPLSPMQLGRMSRWNPFIMLMQVGEDFACRRADRVVSILPLADKYLVTRGMDRSKFVHVPNGIVLDDWAGSTFPLPDVGERVRALKSTGTFVVIYAGAHGPANNLDVVLSAAQHLRDERVCICLVGDGSEKRRLLERRNAEGVTSVEFFSPVPKEAVPQLLECADALLFTLSPSPLFSFGISPNKLMDYMMAGRPIVAAVTAGNNPVKEHGCGLTVAADDALGLADCMRRLMHMTLAERETMGDAGRTAARQHYSYEVLARRFAACFMS